MAVWNFPELCQASAASEVCSISGAPWGRGGGAVFGRSGGALEQKNGNGMSAAPLAGNGGQVHCLHQLWAIVTNAPNGPFGCMCIWFHATLPQHVWELGSIAVFLLQVWIYRSTK